MDQRVIELVQYQIGIEGKELIEYASPQSAVANLTATNISYQETYNAILMPRRKLIFNI